MFGTVTLAGTLSATLGAGFTPVEGNSFVIIDNDGADAVSGTFAGLAQGARVNLGGLNLSITYTGGDGNDVVLEAPVGAPLFTTYLAEGATNAFFDVRIALVNPNTTVATGTMRFLKSTGVTVNHPVTIPAMGRITINPELDVPDMADANFSTVVETNVRVVVDRTMSWDASGYGSHAETSSSAPATTWYFAEGATHGQFTLFYLLQNATSTDAQVVIMYLRPAGAAPIEQPVTVGANSRMTIQVDEVQGLEETDVSAIIRVTNGVPISTERAMYVSTPEQPFAAGTDVAGIAAPSTTWFFAEGATGPFFDFFLLLANPNPTDAQVSVTYDTSMSGSVTKPYTVAANSRQTISVTAGRSAARQRGDRGHRDLDQQRADPGGARDLLAGLPVVRGARVGGRDGDGDAMGVGRRRGRRCAGDADLHPDRQYGQRERHGAGDAVARGGRHADAGLPDSSERPLQRQHWRRVPERDESALRRAGGEHWRHAAADRGRALDVHQCRRRDLGRGHERAGDAAAIGKGYGLRATGCGPQGLRRRRRLLAGP